jgi:hypothetical protein
MQQALESGASAFVLKHLDPRELGAVLRQAHGGDVYQSPQTFEEGSGWGSAWRRSRPPGHGADPEPSCGRTSRNGRSTGGVGVFVPVGHDRRGHEFRTTIRGEFMRRGLTLGVVATAVVTVAMAVTAAMASATTVQKVPVGGTFTVSGLTGSAAGKTRAVGIVLVRKSWDGSSFAYFTKARTDAHGRYRIAITPQRRGLLRLRIVPPDKNVVVFVLRVT